MLRKLVQLSVLLFFVSGCAIWTQLEPSGYTDKKYMFSTVVPANWMRFNAGDYFFMTKDGVILNYIAVYRQKLEKKLEFTKKVFKADMSPQDLSEIQIDEIVANPNAGAFKELRNIPINVDRNKAFRLEYEYTAQGGLKKQGVVCGFKTGDWMYRIQFEAAKQHYYKESIQDFDKFVESFRLLSLEETKKSGQNK